MATQRDLCYYFKFDTNGRKVMQDLGISSEQLDAALKKIPNTNRKVNESFSALAQASLVFSGISSAVQQLSSVVDSLSSAYAVQQQAETQLETVMRQRMSATDEMVQGIKDLCSEQQRLGVIGDEVQLAGAQQLATFVTTESALRTLIPAMNNLGAQQKGLNATGSDMVAIANLMGKAMQGQVTALRRVGISFNDAQAAALKNGNEQQRAALLAEIITQNVGEMNAALAATDAGRQKQLANNLGDVQEKLGAIAQKIQPWLTMASTIVQTGNAYLMLSRSIAPLMGQLRALIPLSTSAAAAIRAVGLAIKSLTIVGAVVGGISLLIDAFNSGSDAADKMADSTKEAASQFDAIKDAQEQAARAAADAQVEYSGFMAKIESFNGTKAQEKKLISELNNKYGDQMKYFHTLADWYKALKTNSDAYIQSLSKQVQLQVLQERMADLVRKKYNLTHDAQGNEITPGSGQPNPVQQKYDLTRGVLNDPNLPKGTQINTAALDNVFALGGGSVPEANARVLENWANSLDSQIEAISSNMADIIKEAAEIVMPMMGSASPDANLKVKHSDDQILPESPLEYTNVAMFDQRIKELTNDLQRADQESYERINEQIKRLEFMRDQFRQGEKVGSMAAPVDTVHTVFAITGRNSIDKTQITEVTDVVKNLNAELGKSVRKAFDFRDAWRGISGIASGIEDITNALSGQGSAWDKISGVIEGGIKIYNTFMSMAPAIGALIDMLTAKKKAETQATTQGAVAEGMKAHAAIPFVGIGLGVAAAATIIATMLSIPKFAKGGIISGPTVGLMGEYSGAASNPEVVAPLDRLQSVLGLDRGGAGGVRTIELKASRGALVATLDYNTLRKLRML